MYVNYFAAMNNVPRDQVIYRLKSSKTKTQIKTKREIHCLITIFFSSVFKNRFRGFVLSFQLTCTQWLVWFIGLVSVLAVDQNVSWSMYVTHIQVSISSQNWCESFLRYVQRIVVIRLHHRGRRWGKKMRQFDVFFWLYKWQIEKRRIKTWVLKFLRIFKNWSHNINESCYTSRVLCDFLRFCKQVCTIFRKKNELTSS